MLLLFTLLGCRTSSEENGGELTCAQCDFSCIPAQDECVHLDTGLGRYFHCWTDFQRCEVQATGECAWTMEDPTGWDDCRYPAEP